MRVIYKYPINFEQEIPLHEGYAIAYVAEQGGVPHIWVSQDLSKPIVRKEFRFVGTGHTWNDDMEKHIGTAICGPYVWHVLERL